MSRLIGWQEGHPACRYLAQAIPRGLLEDYECETWCNLELYLVVVVVAAAMVEAVVVVVVAAAAAAAVCLWRVTAAMSRHTRQWNHWRHGLVTWCWELTSLRSGRPPLILRWSSGCRPSRFPQDSSLLYCRRRPGRTWYAVVTFLITSSSNTDGLCSVLSSDTVGWVTGTASSL